MSQPIKSVITTDMEGRIETFNKGAERLFGYSPTEVIGKRRVSIFSPGEVVLEHVPNWLKEASEKGEFRTRTVFKRKDGSLFAAEIRITPTFKNGKQIGYCGVTVPLDEVSPQEAYPAIKRSTKVFRWLVITRAPFLTASIMPVLMGAAWSVVNRSLSAFPWGLFALVLIGGIAMHIAANTFNDYFDWKSGTDKVNNDYFLPYSGGSRSLELGLITEQGLYRLAWASLGVAILCGLWLITIRGIGLSLFGIFGAFSVYFYTAPPLRLVARKGLGELLIGLNFGPLMVAGTALALSGTLNYLDFVVGMPIGFLVTAILWINEFPDREADALTGKNHLVVLLGKEKARWGYLALVGGSFVWVAWGALSGILPLGALAILLALPMAITAVRVLFEHYADRTLVKANVTTIKLHSIAGLLMTLGIFLSPFLNNLFKN